MKNTPVKIYQECKRFCSHYNLVIWLVLYAIAFVTDFLMVRKTKSKTKEVFDSSSIYKKQHSNLFS